MNLKKDKMMIITMMIISLMATQWLACAKPQRKLVPQTGITEKAPPAKLDMVTNLAREIIIAAGANKWLMVDKSMATLQKDWSDLKPQLAGKVPSNQISAINANVTGLGAAVRSREKIKTQNKANAITGQLADILRNFDSKVPPELPKMGFYLREVVLGAENNDRARIDKNERLTEDTWKKASPQVHNTATGEVNFQDKIDSLKAAVKARQKQNIIKFGNQSLNALDKIEVDFRK